jgi:hypothetical protein
VRYISIHSPSENCHEYGFVLYGKKKADVVVVVVVVVVQ